MPGDGADGAAAPGCFGLAPMIPSRSPAAGPRCAVRMPGLRRSWAGSGRTPRRVGMSSRDAAATPPNSQGNRAAPTTPISTGPTTAPTPKCALSRLSMAALRRPKPVANRRLSP